VYRRKIELTLIRNKIGIAVGTRAPSDIEIIRPVVMVAIRRVQRRRTLNVVFAKSRADGGDVWCTITNVSVVIISGENLNCGLGIRAIGLSPTTGEVCPATKKAACHSKACLRLILGFEVGLNIEPDAGEDLATRVNLTIARILLISGLNVSHVAIGPVEVATNDGVVKKQNSSGVAEALAERITVNAGSDLISLLDVLAVHNEVAIFVEGSRSRSGGEK